MAWSLTGFNPINYQSLFAATWRSYVQTFYGKAKCMPGVGLHCVSQEPSLGLRSIQDMNQAAGLQRCGHALPLTVSLHLEWKSITSNTTHSGKHLFIPWTLSLGRIWLNLEIWQLCTYLRMTMITGNGLQQAQETSLSVSLEHSQEPCWCYNLATVVWFPKRACCLLRGLHDRLLTTARLKNFGKWRYLCALQGGSRDKRSSLFSISLLIHLDTVWKNDSSTVWDWSWTVTKTTVIIIRWCSTWKIKIQRRTYRKHSDFMVVTPYVHHLGTFSQGFSIY